MALPVRRRTTRPDAAAPEAWDPLGELDRLNRQLACYLDQWRDNTNLLGGLFTPPADIEETDDAYVVDIELPGVGKDDLDIEIAGRRLTVCGERKEKERVGILRRRECTIGRFRYEVTLPGNVDEEAVAAHLDDGVLVVRIAKPADERPRRIEIH
jgi:HSP20 family protein